MKGRARQGNKTRQERFSPYPLPRARALLAKLRDTTTRSNRALDLIGPQVERLSLELDAEDADFHKLGVSARASGDEKNAARYFREASQRSEMSFALVAEWGALQTEESGRVFREYAGTYGLSIEVSPEDGKHLVSVSRAQFPTAGPEAWQIGKAFAEHVAGLRRVELKAGQARTPEEVAAARAEFQSACSREDIYGAIRDARKKAGEGTAESSQIDARARAFFLESDRIIQEVQASLERARRRLVRGTLVRRVAPRVTPAYRRTRRFAPRRAARGFRAVRRASAVAQKAASGGGGGDDGSGLDPAPKAPAAFSSARRPTFASILRTAGGAL